MWQARPISPLFAMRAIYNLDLNSLLNIARPASIDSRRMLINSVLLILKCVLRLRGQDNHRGAGSGVGERWDMLSAVLTICGIVTVAGCAHSWCFMRRVREATETDRLVRSAIVANYASRNLTPDHLPVPLLSQQTLEASRKVARGAHT